MALELGRQHLGVSLLVVDDGSREEQALVHEAAVERANSTLASGRSPSRIEYLKLPRNQGKAAAIRQGWAHFAKYEWCGFCDADGATSAGELVRMISALETSDEVDALLGSRIKMAGREIVRTPWRHYPGRLFATMADLVLDLGCYDTQCGAKFFRSKALEKLLPVLEETRWLLDLELLAHMKRLGMRYAEFPIDWHDAAGSKVSMSTDSLRMFLGILRIRRRVDAADRAQ